MQIQVKNSFPASAKHWSQVTLLNAIKTLKKLISHR